jgi:hypothetical protein
MAQAKTNNPAGQKQAESKAAESKAAEQKTAGGGNKGKKVPVLRVQAKAARFRRAGLTFGREEQVIALDKLTDEQVAAIKAEPMLAVIEDEAEA